MKLMSAHWSPILAALSLCMALGAAQAEPTQAQQDAIRAACPADYRAHCASVPTGGAPALQCLEKNVASLSSACQAAVRAVMGGASSSTTTAPAAASTTTTTTDPAAAAAPATTAPAATAAAPAATTTEPAAPAATAPATTAATKAAPTPMVIQPRQEIRLMREACGADYRAHCAGVRIIGGGAVSCLVSHAASLSAACKNEMSRLGQRF